MDMMMNKHKGFSLLEIFITLAMGLVIFAGVLAVFVGMRTTSDETSRYGMMQEKGRFAISILSEDLMRQGFFGDLNAPVSTSNVRDFPDAPTGDCAGDGLNNASFPVVGSIGHYRTIWGETVDDANIMGCITNARTDSDVLQIKRTITSVLAGAQSTSRYYLYSNNSEGEVVQGIAVPDPVIDNARIFEYQHHIYFVSNETRGNQTIPRLNLRRLTTTMQSQPLLDGVEQIRFLYGVDTDLDGSVNIFLSADEMNASGGGTGRFWDNAGTRILAVKIYVLIRDDHQDTSYTNNTSYYLGYESDNSGKFTAPGDHFRRMLFSSTVSLFNGDAKIWD